MCNTDTQTSASFSLRSKFNERNGEGGREGTPRLYVCVEREGGRVRLDSRRVESNRLCPPLRPRSVSGMSCFSSG